jgi:hypothetical protein
MPVGSTLEIPQRDGDNSPALGDQLHDPPHHPTEFCFWIDFARDADLHPLDEINPPLPGLDSPDEVLLPANSLGQLTLRQTRPFTQFHHRGDKFLMGGGEHRSNHCQMFESPPA